VNPQKTLEYDTPEKSKAPCRPKLLDKVRTLVDSAGAPVLQDIGKEEKLHVILGKRLRFGDRLDP
jgi:hypothetical protein